MLDETGQYKISATVPGREPTKPDPKPTLNKTKFQMSSNFLYAL